MKAHLILASAALLVGALSAIANPEDSEQYITDPTSVKIVNDINWLSTNKLEILIGGRRIAEIDTFMPGIRQDPFVDEINKKIERITEAHQQVRIDVKKLRDLVRWNAEHSRLGDHDVPLADAFIAVESTAISLKTASYAPGPKASKHIVLDVNALTQAGYVVVCPVCDKNDRASGTIVKVGPSEIGGTSGKKYEKASDGR